MISLAARRGGMVLFSGPEDHYSHRVRIVLEEKSVKYALEPLPRGEISEELLEINPYGTVPTFCDRELALYESGVIMEYLDERFPHPPLMPALPVERGHIRLYVYRIGKDCCQSIDRILAPDVTEEEQERLRKDLLERLLGIAPTFAEKKFFLSDEFTLADCCMAPILLRLPRLGLDLGKSAQTRPLLNYRDRLFARESFGRSLSEDEKDMWEELDSV